MHRFRVKLHRGLYIEARWTNLHLISGGTKESLPASMSETKLYLVFFVIRASKIALDHLVIL
jgi:hypothetical protein